MRVQFNDGKKYANRKRTSKTTITSIMQLKSTIIALLAAGASLPSSSAAKWNPKLKVWDIGRVPSEPNFPGLAKEVVGKCGGIPEGGYVCGSFGPGKIVAMRAIYKCVDGNLVRKEVCSEKARNNRCVKNSRRKGKKFFPLESGDKIVCQKKKVVEKP